MSQTNKKLEEICKNKKNLGRGWGFGTKNVEALGAVGEKISRLEQ